MIQKIYNELLRYLDLENVEYKVLSKNIIDFSTSDIDFILSRVQDLKKIKKFISRYKIKKIIKIDNKYQYYFILIHEGTIHAFDFTVGLIVNHIKICDADYFVCGEMSGIDYTTNYKFLKNRIKNSEQYYVVKKKKITKLSKFQNYIKKMIVNFKRYYSADSNGLYIAILGVDGCGKSTVVKSINEELSINRRLFQVKNIYFKPQLIKVKPDKVFNKDIVYPPHQNKTYSSFFSIAKVFYIFINYLLYSPILYLRKNTGQLIVFDRHFYDILIDNKRYGINAVGANLARKIYMLIPKPDLVIVLNSGIERLMLRKPGEVPKPLLIDLNGKYKNFLLKDVVIKHIENNGSLDELKSNVIGLILKGLV